MEYYSGRIWSDDPFDGYVGIEGDVIKEIGSGPPPEPPVRTGHISASVVDCHTHIGDAGLVLDRTYSIEELVAPPDGLKHRYLATCPDEQLIGSMRDYAERLCSVVTEFIDFREGGVKGARMIRDATDKAIVLGRPTSARFDVNEVEGLLEVADGIGVPSISDMPVGYIDALADMAHRKGKLFAIHVSERIREDMDVVLSFEPDFVVHMCEATDADMLKCSDADIPVVVCASSNLYFGKVPPIGRLASSGVSLSIGTDNAMLCPPDFLREASVFSSVAVEQGCSHDVTHRALFLGGSKCLITRNRIGWDVGDRMVPCVLGHDSIVTQ